MNQFDLPTIIVILAVIRETTRLIIASALLIRVCRRTSDCITHGHQAPTNARPHRARLPSHHPRQQPPPGPGSAGNA